MSLKSKLIFVLSSPTSESSNFLLTSTFGPVIFNSKGDVSAYASYDRASDAIMAIRLYLKVFTLCLPKQFDKHIRIYKCKKRTQFTNFHRTVMFLEKIKIESGGETSLELNGAYFGR